MPHKKCNINIEKEIIIDNIIFNSLSLNIGLGIHSIRGYRITIL